MDTATEPTIADQLVLFNEIGKAERHFNELQSNYRRIASLWLLAAFSAIGLVFSNATPLPIDPLLASAVVAGFAGAGLVLLWTMDLLVYHRLLDSYFLEGLVLERKFDFLPKIRHNMMNSQDGTGKGVLVRVINFYVVPVNAMIVVGACSLFAYFARSTTILTDSVFTAGFAAAGALLLTLAACWLLSRELHRRTMSTDLFEKRLSRYPVPTGYDE